MILGDVHGEYSWLKQVVSVAVRMECEKILQIGDFGWWPHFDWGKAFIDSAIKLLQREGIELSFIDGNHENFNDLWKYGRGTDRPVTSRGFVKMADNLYYIPRGTRWEWYGANFLGLGGGFSIDKAGRRPDITWWEQETLRICDVEKAIYGKSSWPRAEEPLKERVDIMVSHDAPAGLAIFEQNPNYKNDPRSQANRRAVTEVVEAVKPLSLFHGHMHNRHSATLALKSDPAHVVQVEGLARDGDWGSVYVVTIEK